VVAGGWGRRRGRETTKWVQDFFLGLKKISLQLDSSSGGLPECARLKWQVLHDVYFPRVITVIMIMIMIKENFPGKSGTHSCLEPPGS
jgi:hypothetical protein